MGDLTAGQSVAQRFTLSERLPDPAGLMQWRAVDEQRGAGARLTLLSDDPSRDPAGEVEAALKRAAALVHPGLVKVIGLFHEAGQPILAHDDPEESSSLTGSAGANQPLERLLPVVETLAFLHDLGFAHGGLRWDALRVDGNGRILLDRLGLEWLRKNALPAPANDIAALGELLEEASGARAGTPVAPPLAELFAGMRGEAQSVSNMHEVHRRLARALGVDAGVPLAQAVEPVPAGRIEALGRGVTGTATASVNAPRSRSVPLLLALPALLVLLAGAVYVLFFLPGPGSPPPAVAGAGSDTAAEAAPGTTTAGPSAQSSAAAPGNAPFAAAANARERQAAQDAAITLLRSLVALEERAAGDWAPDALADARKAGEDGDALYREQAYARALARYREGIELAESLVVRSGEVLAEALESGEAALAAGDGETARGHFERALAIDKEHPQASQGLERVARLDEVLEKMRRGADFEQAGELAAARAEYEAARALDGQFSPAGEALQRVAGRQGAQRFQNLMSSGFRELDAGNAAAARKAFAEAARLRPNAAGPKDALAQVAAKVRTQDIASRRREAAAAEEREDWITAESIYASILKTDDTLVFAREGRERSAARAQLSERLQLYIDEPLRMAANPAYNDARAALVAARQVAAPGPRLAAQIAELEARVAVARDPVMVRLRSDGQTRVVILKLGEIGRFEEQAVGLVPGRYTAVGSRVGYRDVRREFEVRAGTPPAPISIICEEPV